MRSKSAQELWCVLQCECGWCAVAQTSSESQVRWSLQSELGRRDIARHVGELDVWASLRPEPGWSEFAP